jgi:hypothetical protein
MVAASFLMLFFIPALYRVFDGAATSLGNLFSLSDSQSALEPSIMDLGTEEESGDGVQQN